MMLYVILPSTFIMIVKVLDMNHFVYHSNF